MPSQSETAAPPLTTKEREAIAASAQNAVMKFGKREVGRLTFEYLLRYEATVAHLEAENATLGRMLDDEIAGRDQARAEVARLAADLKASHEERARIEAERTTLGLRCIELREDGERVDWIEEHGLPDPKEYDGLSLRQVVDAVRRSGGR